MILFWESSEIMCVVTWEKSRGSAQLGIFMKGVVRCIRKPSELDVKVLASCPISFQFWHQTQ